MMNERWRQMFAVNEAEHSRLICRIISATLKGPFECYVLVNLSDVQHIQLNGETSQGPKAVGCCGSLVRTLTLLSGQNMQVSWIHWLFLVLPIEDLSPMNAFGHAICLLTQAERQTAVSLKPVKCFLFPVLIWFFLKLHTCHALGLFYVPNSSVKSCWLKKIKLNYILNI